MHISKRVLAAIICLQFLAIYLVAENNSDDAEQAQAIAAEAKALAKTNHDVIAKIADAQQTTCEEDAQRTRQGKIRAIAIEHLEAALIKLIASSPVSDIDPVTSQAAIDQFAKDMERIVILPLPDCVARGNAIREGEGIAPPNDKKPKPSGGGDASSPPASSGGG